MWLVVPSVFVCDLGAQAAYRDSFFDVLLMGHECDNLCLGLESLIPPLSILTDASSGGPLPAGLEGEPGGVAAVAPQRAERPHHQLDAGVVHVPQVDVLVGDLHGALAVDVQVRRGHQVHVEPLCGGVRG